MSVNMQATPRIRTLFSVLVALPILLIASLQAQQHGRKYKPPPATSHIEVEVTKKFNGKPIMNAAVVFNPSTKDGKDLGSLEVKTDPEGKAAIDIIPTGSVVQIQVIATGFSTFAKDYTIDQPSRSISIALLRPQEQVSSFNDNEGKLSTRKPGVQEPDWPTNHPNQDTNSSTRPAANSKPSDSSKPADKSSSTPPSTSPAPAQNAPKQ